MNIDSCECWHLFSHNLNLFWSFALKKYVDYNVMKHRPSKSTHKMLYEFAHLFYKLFHSAYLACIDINYVSLNDMKLFIPCIMHVSSGLGVVHKLCWQDFGFFWPPTPLCWHFLWYERWQNIDIFGPPTYLPPLLNVVCEQAITKELLYSLKKFHCQKLLEDFGQNVTWCPV